MVLVVKGAGRKARRYNTCIATLYPSFQHAQLYARVEIGGTPKNISDGVNSAELDFMCGNDS